MNLLVEAVGSGSYSDFVDERRKVKVVIHEKEIRTTEAVVVLYPCCLLAS